ncbi:MAG TPA: nucleotidyltransferase domain-containing protein [Ktedonosporobacter sp.]|jgi:predicted nucleotidyltransferase|nr:nucleotidyltransferase domain-containing protein [Ktedonosporobacter sp.]
MNDIHLQNTLGHPQIDAIVQEVIQLYEDAFPGQIAAYYVEGSYADQTSLTTSDVDLLIVFRGRFANEDTCSLAKRLWRSDLRGSQEVDISLVDEDGLLAGVHPNVKLGSRLLYGEDVCRLYPLMPIESWTRERMHAAYWLLVNVYHRSTPLRLPLTFPSPADEFYGYMNRMLQLPEGREVPCSRNLVRTTGWAATALLALQTGQYAARKRDCVRLYREYIGDEWTALLEEITTSCRDEWQYLIPTAPHARKRLREICERTLRFEQHFLTCYRSYLLEQLRSTEQEHIRVARQFQEQSPLDDAEIIALLQNSKSTNYIDQTK